MTPSIPLKDRDPKKVFVAIMVNGAEMGTLRFQTLFSLLKLAGEIEGYQFLIHPGGGCDVCHARNLSLHRWRTRTDCGRLLWIDADVVFEPEHLIKLLSWDVPYIGGIYPLKDSTLRWSYNGWSKYSQRNPKWLWDVQELCTGFTAMRFDLLEQLIEAHPQAAYDIEDNEYRGEEGFELCAMGVINRRRTPEDFYLSHRIRALGHEILVDPYIQLDHVGSFPMLRWHSDKQEQARKLLLAKTIK